MAGLTASGHAAVTASVTGEHLAALRAFLTSEYTTFDRISSRLDADGSWQAYAALQGAAFAVAARRRFPGGYHPGEVIRFVGRARTALRDEAGQVDPGTAERLFRGVLSDPACAAGLDQNSAAVAMAALLKALVAEEGLSGRELDGFLAESCYAARRADGQQSPRHDGHPYPP